MKKCPSYKMELHKILGFLLVRVDSCFPGRQLGLRELRKWPLQSPNLTVRDFLWDWSKEEAYQLKLRTRAET
jgi:hypothetical protein